MSRVGKMPVNLPQGVDVAITAEKISVKGTLGTLVRPANPLVNVSNTAGKLEFIPADGTTAAADASVKVTSGALESSNVNVADAVTPAAPERTCAPVVDSAVNAPSAMRQRRSAAGFCGSVTVPT